MLQTALISNAGKIKIKIKRRIQNPISKMEPFAKIVQGFQPLINFAKSSILDVDWFLNEPLK